MLTYGEALTAIESNTVTTDNAADVLAAIKNNVAQVLNEKRRVVARNAEIESNLQSILAVSGASGDDFQAQIADLNDKMRKLKADLESERSRSEKLEQEKTAIAAEKTQLEQKQASFQRSEQINTIAEKVGANKTVLTQLLKEVELDKLAIAEDKVTIDGKPFEEWAESETVKPFAASLFEQGKPDQQNQQTRLPSSPPAKPTEQGEGLDRAYAIATGRDPSKLDWITQRKTIG